MEYTTSLPIIPKYAGVNMDVKIDASLPEIVHGIEYVTNHHYIKLTDKEGNKLKLNAKSLLMGRCITCKQVFYVQSRMGNMVCPHCCGVVKWSWGKFQTGFVPEEESGFMTPKIFNEVKDIVKDVPEKAAKNLEASQDDEDPNSE